jgi:hypothetical protein
MYHVSHGQRVLLVKVPVVEAQRYILRFRDIFSLPDSILPPNTTIDPNSKQHRRYYYQ